MLGTVWETHGGNLWQELNGENSYRELVLGTVWELMKETHAGINGVKSWRVLMESTH